MNKCVAGMTCIVSIQIQTRLAQVLPHIQFPTHFKANHMS